MSQSVVPCLVLTCFLSHIYTFLRKQVSWNGTLIYLRIFQFVVIHTVKGFSIVNEAEVHVLLELLCFLHDTVNVGNLISGSSAPLKFSLHIWIFLVPTFLKPHMKDFVHTQLYGSLKILWHFPSLGLEWKLTFSSPVACWVFQICWHIECNT